MTHLLKSFSMHSCAPACWLAVCLLAGCVSETGNPLPPPPEPEPLYFETLGRGISASLSDTTQIVIRDATEWAGFSPLLHTRLPMKKVDFSQVIVLLAAVPAPSSGYAVTFESVELSADSILARYVLMQPGEDCMTANAQTVPFEAVIVRRAEGPVHFERLREDVPCSLP